MIKRICGYCGKEIKGNTYKICKICKRNFHIDHNCPEHPNGPMEIIRGPRIIVRKPINNLTNTWHANPTSLWRTIFIILGVNISLILFPLIVISILHIEQTSFSAILVLTFIYSVGSITYILTRRPFAAMFSQWIPLILLVVLSNRKDTIVGTFFVSWILGMVFHLTKKYMPTWWSIFVGTLSVAISFYIIVHGLNFKSQSLLYSIISSLLAIPVSILIGRVFKKW